MNRRGFLRMIGGAATAVSTNPVHFLAPPGGWQQTGQIYTRAYPPDEWEKYHLSKISNHILDGYGYACGTIRKRNLDGTVENDEELRKRIFHEALFNRPEGLIVV